MKTDIYSKAIRKNQIKSNKIAPLWFRLLSIFAPNTAINVVRSRYVQRMYSGAESFPSSDWSTVGGNASANSEIGRAQKVLISRSRDLGRNNPYAKKATDVIVSNVVGAGIIPSFTGRNKSETKALMREWRRIAETSRCDIENSMNFYAQQALAMRTIVESGEVLALKYQEPDAPKLQILEPDFIDSSDVLTMNGSSKNQIKNGIEVDSRNRRVAYFLYEEHPGDQLGSTKSNRIEASRVIHSYSLTRPGQIRGVPWSHAVINTLKDFDDFQYATIVRQKIAACLVGVITNSGGNSAVERERLNAIRKEETMMTPGSFKYANPGEDVTFNSPPPAQGYGEFIAETIRAVACGYGITYESISNDYSRVNFSSGRMGHLEMRKNIDHWRWNMLIPQFCDKYMELFLEHCKMTGIIRDPKDILVEWTPPAYAMIDPSKEISSAKEAIKAGIRSKSSIIREYGDDPDLVREEIKLERDADLNAGLSFDVYTTTEKIFTNSQATESVEENSIEDEENQKNV